MAWWAAENPNSLLRQGTAQFPIDPKVASVDRIDQLQQFYDPSHRRDEKGRITASKAVELVESFLSFHLPSVPFRRSALRTALGRCQDAAGEHLCDEVRRQAEAVLGDLAIETTEK